MIFYYDKNKKYYSKSEALIANEKNQVSLYYYDKEFSNLDWKNTPSKSLTTLYRERAQNIRDNYEYVILCFSGGIDSSNILETFYYNNILIDEIVIVGAFSQDSKSGSDENHNGELYHNAFELLKSIHIPKTKINVIDYSLMFNNIANFSVFHDDQWANNIGSKKSPHNWFWKDLRKHVGGKDKKTGIIFGVDKPIINVGCQNLSFSFKEANLMCYGRNLNNIHVENSDFVFFYWDIDAQELLRKQVGIVRDFYNENVIEKNLISNDFFKRNLLKITQSLVYKLNTPLNFISPKSPSPLISLRDQFLFKKNNSEITKFYISGLKKINHKIIEFSSRKYYL